MKTVRLTVCEASSQPGCSFVNVHWRGCNHLLYSSANRAHQHRKDVVLVVCVWGGGWYLRWSVSVSISPGFKGRKGRRQIVLCGGGSMCQSLVAGNRGVVLLYQRFDPNHFTGATRARTIQAHTAFNVPQ